MTLDRKFLLQCIMNNPSLSIDLDYEPDIFREKEYKKIISNMTESEVKTELEEYESLCNQQEER